MKKYSIKEIQKWLRGLEENKWRKRYAVDAKRVCHFANLGEDVELPTSLQRKSEASYKRERYLAREFKRWHGNQLKLKENKIIALQKYIRKTIKEELGG